MTPKKSLQWTLFWVLSAILFAIGIFHLEGAEKASEFINVFMVEKLLSFDNLMVFLLIFTYFKVPDKDRRRVLNWGLIGAAVLRAICITGGIAMVQHFTWILYGLGGLLIYSAYGMAFGAEDGEEDVENSLIIRFTSNLHIPVFFVWVLSIELSDIAFAIDSIPAGLSISQDLFIVYAANVFAILGLRSFYFAIQALYGYLPGLKYGVSLVLAFIGVKMFLPLAGYHMNSGLSLAIVVGILTVNVLVIVESARQNKLKLKKGI